MFGQFSLLCMKGLNDEVSEFNFEMTQIIHVELGIVTGNQN